MVLATTLSSIVCQLVRMRLFSMRKESREFIDYKCMRKVTRTWQLGGPAYHSRLRDRGGKTHQERETDRQVGFSRSDLQCA